MSNIIVVNGVEIYPARMMQAMACLNILFMEHENMGYLDKKRVAKLMGRQPASIVYYILTLKLLGYCKAQRVHHFKGYKIGTDYVFYCAERDLEIVLTTVAPEKTELRQISIYDNTKAILPSKPQTKEEKKRAKQNKALRFKRFELTRNFKPSADFSMKCMVYGLQINTRGPEFLHQLDYLRTLENRPKYTQDVWEHCLIRNIKKMRAQTPGLFKTQGCRTYVNPYELDDADIEAMKMGSATNYMKKNYIFGGTPNPIPRHAAKPQAPQQAEQDIKAHIAPAAAPVAIHINAESVYPGPLKCTKTEDQIAFGNSMLKNMAASVGVKLHQRA